MIDRILLSFAIIALSGCTGMVSTAPRPDAYFDVQAAVTDSESLFSGDEAVLSDADIQRILQFDYAPPALSRVALMPFGREAWSMWSEEVAIATERMQTQAIKTLASSPAVYDASYLPSILIPEHKSVPHLREAAARYQADLLLVYRSYCRSFERYRIFAADQSRAYCGVEAILLDTRTGLVPFTTAILKSFDLKEQHGDMNFRETIVKAQLGAVDEALRDVSNEILTFLAEHHPEERT